MTDTGIGIGHEDQKKLFKLYGFLEASEKVNAKGIGLGLFISKKIVNKFGGGIRVRSRLGVGTEFTFTFPLETQVNEERFIGHVRHLNPS